MSHRSRMLCSVFFVVLAAWATICSVNAASPSDGSALRLVALDFVKNVVGIGVDGYNVTSDCNGPMDSLLYPGHTEALVRLILCDAGSQLEMEMKFIDSHLTSYRLASYSGRDASAGGNSFGILGAVKEALSRYQTVFSASYVSQLAPMTDDIMNTERAQTIEADVATMRFNPNASLSGSATFTWSCKNAARKSIGISMNREGVLDWFSDSWGINTVSNLEIKVSEQVALEMASDIANTYANQLGARVAKVDATFEYINSYSEARGGDPLILYPSWNIEFTFDRPCGDNAQGAYITGYFVGVWADTGEVRTAMPQGFWGQLPEPVGNSGGPLLALGIASAAVFVVAGALVLSARKRRKDKKAK